MVHSRIQRQHDSLWQRVKWLLAGRIATLNHRWSSVSPFDACVMKSVSKLFRSCSLAARNVRSIFPSKMPIPSQERHKKVVWVPVTMLVMIIRLTNQDGDLPLLSCQTRTAWILPRSLESKILVKDGNDIRHVESTFMRKCQWSYTSFSIRIQIRIMKTC